MVSSIEFERGDSTLDIIENKDKKTEYHDYVLLKSFHNNMKSEINFKNPTIKGYIGYSLLAWLIMYIIIKKYFSILYRRV